MLDAIVSFCTTCCIKWAKRPASSRVVLQPLPQGAFPWLWDKRPGDEVESSSAISNVTSPPSPLSHTRIARTVIQRHHSGSNRLCDDYPDFKHDRIWHTILQPQSHHEKFWNQGQTSFLLIRSLCFNMNQSIYYNTLSFQNAGNGINEKCAITVELSVRPPPKIRRFNGSLTKIKPQLSLSRRGSEVPKHLLFGRELIAWLWCAFFHVASNSSSYTLSSVLRTANLQIIQCV